MRIVSRTLQKFFRLTAAVSSQAVRNHCQSSTTLLGKMKVRLVPALEDNYMYILIDEASNQCAVVDPVEPENLLKAVKEEGAEIKCVMTTHHHWDHAGGNEKLVKMLGKSADQLQVYGGDERVGALTRKVTHNDEFKVGSLNVKCLFTPCHTTGHICYYVTGEGAKPAVFTGDTLFSGGCGRFFEGTAEHMYKALITILSGLPKDTQVFCGHEYTVQNLTYALHVEPDNGYIQKKMSWAKDLRANRKSTIPSTIEEEMKINPFMRVSEAAVQKHVGGSNDVIEVMRLLRKEKDNFKAK